MAGLWQRTGNVTVTNGSKTITGFGTKWKTGTLPIQKGHTFYGPDNAAYEVDTVVSDTEILLVDTYRGGTMANQPYRIDITRTSTISQFAADLASLVGKYRSWFDGMMTWLTGSGDVAILNPDTGANVTIPSWKKVASEGEGQTARAKVEADRAKTEADRAFTEADRAAGIVAAAALPLPDVWAPLSDSLRLITGYGRDVLVGSDVVARMVNFARSSTATYIGKDGQLKTAAANEPRFEKEGLLVEGQSTNLWPVQSGANLNVMNAPQETVTLPTGVSGNAYKVTPSSTSYSYVRFSSSQQTGTHTLSCFARKADGSEGMPTIYAGSGGALNIKASGVYLGAGWWRMYALLTDPVGNTGVGFTPSALDQIPVHICFFQLEALPFASSYIPTNGAAVTRAADQAWIPAAGNRFISGMYAVACEFDLLGRVLGGGFTRLVDFDNSGGADRQHLSLNDGGQLQCVMGTGPVAGVAGKLSGRAAMRMNNFTLNVMMDGVAGSSVTASGVGSSANNRIVLMNTNIFNIPSYGHIRNLRMWSKHPISNEQLRTAV